MRSGGSSSFKMTRKFPPPLYNRLREALNLGWPTKAAIKAISGLHVVKCNGQFSICLSLAHQKHLTQPITSFSLMHVLVTHDVTSFVFSPSSLFGPSQSPLLVVLSPQPLN